MCGNKSAQVNNVNWYEAENGVFKKMSIALKKISAATWQVELSYQK